MDNLSKQTVEATIRQYQHQLENIQDEQLLNKKEQQRAEEWHERLVHLQKEEQALYQESIFECDSEERAFFEDRSGDSQHLSQKAFFELEELSHELEREKIRLIEKEDRVIAEQRLALTDKSEVESYGT